MGQTWGPTGINKNSKNGVFGSFLVYFAGLISKTKKNETAKLGSLKGKVAGGRTYSGSPSSSLSPT